MAGKVVKINRAPVLTLWAAVVAEALGYDHDTALTLGRCVAGLNAQSKGRMLGIFGPPKTDARGSKPKKVGLGDDLKAVRDAMTNLAQALDQEELAANAYKLYERFRPVIPKGTKGWGAKGDLDLELVRSLAG